MPRQPAVAAPEPSKVPVRCGDTPETRTLALSGICGWRSDGRKVRSVRAVKPSREFL